MSEGLDFASRQPRRDRQPRPTRLCVVCGETFIHDAPPSLQRKYCSRECANRVSRASSRRFIGTAGRVHPTKSTTSINAGASNPRAKLTNEQVADLRARYSRGGVSMAELASEYGVSRQHIQRIVSGNSWRLP